MVTNQSAPYARELNLQRPAMCCCLHGDECVQGCILRYSSEALPGNIGKNQRSFVAFLTVTACLHVSLALAISNNIVIDNYMRDNR